MSTKRKWDMNDLVKASDAELEHEGEETCVYSVTGIGLESLADYASAHTISRLAESGIGDAKTSNDLWFGMMVAGIEENVNSSSVNREIYNLGIDECREIEVAPLAAQIEVLTARVAELTELTDMVFSGDPGRLGFIETGEIGGGVFCPSCGISPQYLADISIHKPNCKLAKYLIARDGTP